ncbi:hypothetical protein L9F63_012092 [Diploptera punctata]|uniref:tRNA (adenine(58)-N(1))-methyltransferase non-catalytic subunit TRM6 n=1 Tax=Diploptera punctata TaxID=6984 RepID=A0AAD8ADY9_DIPPU|nr:hypothetical protein L9F63_012092 [Diploptera punctata]
MADNFVKVGDFVVVQRQSYTKLYRVSSKECLLGKDQIDMGAIIDRPVWTTYKMIPKKHGKRSFYLEECNNTESLSEQLLKNVTSGADNRNIFDDGSSQLLSTEEIVELRTSGLSGQEIVGQLIENSKTFQNKTEYSQEKYLKKKEKKYFEYVTIRWPTIRLISDIMYRVDPTKIMGLRMDALAQILTTIGLHSNGTYMIYESGCQALVVAGMLSQISEGGHLIHVHPGNFAQRNAVNAMNFSSNQLSHLIQVNIYSLLRKLWQGNSSKESNGVVKSETDEKEDKAENENSVKQQEQVQDEKSKILSCNYDIDMEEQIDDSFEEAMDDDEANVQNKSEDNSNSKKRKHPDDCETVSKMPRWEQETEKAVDILKSRKVDGLVIVSREHPANILTALMPYLDLSRPFVVYCMWREPLLELSVQLKSKHDTVSLRLTETWMRKHQVLPSRTHPDILTSGGSGYILSGILVDNGSKR